VEVHPYNLTVGRILLRRSHRTQNMAAAIFAASAFADRAAVAAAPCPVTATGTAVNFPITIIMMVVVVNGSAIRLTSLLSERIVSRLT
jgi:hypothetical protein